MCAGLDFGEGEGGGVGVGAGGVIVPLPGFLGEEQVDEVFVVAGGEHPAEGHGVELAAAGEGFFGAVAAVEGLGGGVGGEVVSQEEDGCEGD